MVIAWLITVFWATSDPIMGLYTPSLSYHPRLWGSTRVVHFGVTRSPNDAWVTQQLREATPFGDGPRFLICDNDGKFGDQFERIAKGTGIKVIHTPVEAPKANSICERFISSVRRERLDHILILSEHHLHRKVKDYVQYFNHARPHQGINGQIPIPSSPPPSVVPSLSQLRRIPILGGLHHNYQWAAQRKNLVRMT